MDSHRATELEPGIVQLELTRPHRNALSSNAVAELHHEIDLIGGDPAIRVVILTGEGPSFCAGSTERRVTCRVAVLASPKFPPLC